MSQLAPLLLQAQSPDHQAREAAEAELFRLENDEYVRFVLDLVGLLADGTAPIQARQLAGILLKNSLSGRFGSAKEGATERWLAQIGAAERKQVHCVLIQALGTVQGGASVRRQAAQALAQVAVVELPHGQWPQLIEQLVQPLTQAGSSDALKHGCVEALGYICEEPSVAGVIAHQSNLILTALVQGMRGDHETTPTEPPVPKENTLVRRAATTALFNALAFVAQNMENEVERDMIMRTVMMAAAEPADAELRRSAYECLVGIASQYYEKLACPSPSNPPLTFIEMAFQLTCHAIQYDQEDVAVQAIEFWSSVADVEIKRLEEHQLLQNGTLETAYLGIVEQAAPALIPLLTQCLIRRDEDEDVEGENWNRVLAASACVSLFAQVAPKATLEAAVPFIREHLDVQRNWRSHEAALVAVGSIAVTFTSANDEQTTLEVFALPLRMLETAQNEAVRDTAAWSLGRLIAHLVTHLNANVIEAALTALMRALADTPRVARSACYALTSLIETQHESAEALASISAATLTLANALWQTAQRDDADEWNLLASSYETLIALVQQSSPENARSLAREYLPLTMHSLERALQESDAMLAASANQPAFQIEIQGLLCGLIQVFVQHLDPPLLEGTTSRLVEMILQVLNRNRSVAVHEDALMALGSIASTVEHAFASYAAHAMPFVLASVRNWEAYHVCAVAIGTISDICRALEKRFEPFAAETVQVLLAALENTLLNRTVKPPILCCIGDIALALEGAFEPYLDPCIAALQHAAWSTLQTPVLDDETNDWILEMRQCILDAYTGIINGLNAAQKAGLLIDRQQVEWVIRFCEQVSQEVVDDEDMLRAVVGVMGDIGQTFGPAAVSALRELGWLRPIVEKLCISGRRKSTRETATWAFGVLFS
jgi:importin subunit beta-1